MTFTCFSIIGSLYAITTSKKKEIHADSLPSYNNNNNEKVSKKSPKPSVFANFWSCFSLKHNTNFILETKLNKSSIAPIHGIRTIGMLWIIAGHVYYFALSPTDNMQYIFANDQFWMLQILYAAASSVDSFFVIR